MSMPKGRDTMEKLELNNSITPNKELLEFINNHGSLSEAVRGNREGEKREKKVTTVEAGRRYSRLGFEYIEYANECALRVISLEEKIDTLTSQLASSNVRSETDAIALRDLRSDFETAKEQSRISSSSLTQAYLEVEKLSSDLKEKKEECEQLALKNDVLSNDLLSLQTHLEVEKEICKDMRASVRVSKDRLRESEKERWAEVGKANLTNSLTGVKLHQIEKEKRRLERKIDRLSTPTPSPISITGGTPKRRLFGSAEFETPTTKRRRRPTKAFAHLSRDQRRARAGDALSSIEEIVACHLDPASGNGMNGRLDLLNLNQMQIKDMSIHFLKLLHVIERNWKDHPLIHALERWRGGKKRQLTPWESISLAANNDLSQNVVKKLKREFLSLGAVDPFGSTRDCDYLRDIIDIGRQLIGTHIECKGKRVPVMGVAPLKIRKVLEGLCCELFKIGTLKGGSVRILNIGDGGGGVCKLGLSFADVANPLSERNLFTYLVFQGSDEWEELRTIATRWARAINRIKTLTFDVDGESHTVSVEWYAGGDCKYLAAIYGLKNASAKEPCPFCYTDKAGKVISNRIVDIRARSLSGLKLTIPRKCRLRTAPARTLRSYQYDGKYGNKSVKGKPLFHIKVENCVPPGLHAIQGAFDTLIEVIARRMITNEYLVEKGVKPLEKSLEKTVSIEEKKRKEREDDLKELESTLSDLTVSVSLLESMLNGTLLDERSNKSKIKLRCSDRCLISNRENYMKVSRNNRSKIKCGLCQQMIHFFCDDIISPSDQQTAKEEARNEYTCKDCDQRGIPISDRLNMAKERAKEIEKKIEHLQRKMRKRKNHLEILKNLKEENGGEPARRLESAVKEAGADRQAWFQRYTGNQVRKVLRPPCEGKKSGAEIICGIFDNVKSPLAPVLFEALTLLGRMQAASVARDLEPTEIEQFKKDKDLFFRCLATLDPKCTMRLKLHILDRHVYPFMLKHGTWGRFLEQAIESKHAKWNKKARVYCSSKKQLFVHWKTIMSDMFIQLLFHLNPNRDYADVITEYKKMKKRTLNWSDHHGERIVRATDLPELSDEESDVDLDVETPFQDEHESVFDFAHDRDEYMEVD